MATMTFETHDLALEHFDRMGWTDGLPVVPPTRARVDDMVAAGGRHAGEVLGSLPQRRMSVTVEQAATCAVMAGCLPEYFPVVLATWDAAFMPGFKLHTVLSTTGGPAVMGVVSGPYAAEIGMNAGTGVMGSGNRANATIGRAFRLGVIIALGARTGVLDMATFGHAGKFSFHFPEAPPPAPWRPVHEQLGFPAGTTTVTLMPAEAPRQIMQRFNPDADGLLSTLAACLANPSQGGAGRGTYWTVVLGPEHAGILLDAGLTQAEVRQQMSERSRVTREELLGAGIPLVVGDRFDITPDMPERLVTVRPEDLLVLTAGGRGAGFSVAIPCWTKSAVIRPASAPVRFPGQAPAAPGPELREVNYLG